MWERRAKEAQSFWCYAKFLQSTALPETCVDIVIFKKFENIYACFPVVTCTNAFL